MREIFPPLDSAASVATLETAGITVFRPWHA